MLDSAPRQIFNVLPKNEYETVCDQSLSSLLEQTAGTSLEQGVKWGK